MTTSVGARQDGPAASTQTSGAQSERSTSHWVQLGLFGSADNAERLARSLRQQGFPVQVASVAREARDGAGGGAYHLVRAGAFPDQARAAAARDDLRLRGYSGFLTEGAAR